MFKYHSPVILSFYNSLSQVFLVMLFSICLVFRHHTSTFLKAFEMILKLSFYYNFNKSYMSF